ncbi:MAG: cation:proton antiporter [Gemmataceae bacterium]
MPLFADASLLKQMRDVHVEDLLLPLLIQLAIIIAVARVFAWLFRRMGQPAVVGEIAAGLVLGPSFLGWVAPQLFAMVFRPTIAELPPDASDLMLSRVLTALAQIGLILLLFLIGLEFDFGHLRYTGPAALAISLAGVLLPFGLGIGLGTWMHGLVAPGIPWLSFVLFMGTSMSITAIPILGRMMMEMGITRTRIAAVTISAAAVDDACGWILLAAVAAASRTTFSALQTGGMIVATVGFGLFMVFIARPILARAARAALKAGGGELGLNSLAALFVLLFICSIITNVIGIFAIFGAFLLGAILSEEHEFRDAVIRRLRDIVTAFFLPIFFAYTGLRTNIGSLETWQLWTLAGAVSFVAILGKFGGCTLAAWLFGLRPREAACVGIMMNTRALMELIVINVGKDLGVIPDSVFCMLVLMALLTTFMTTPILLRLMRGTELEPYIRGSGFLGDQQQTADPLVEGAGGSSRA